jgi:hypothetical protein
MQSRSRRSISVAARAVTDEADLSVNEVEPHAAPRVDFVRHVLSGLEQGSLFVSRTALCPTG